MTVRLSRCQMKYVLIIGDGMSDTPIEELGGRTPLEVAEHPNMDLIASKGFCGMLDTQCAVSGGTDAAILSILGYDSRKLSIGRGALEAAGIGVNLSSNDLAFRCNLITVQNGFLRDHSAGGISTEEARILIDAVNTAYSKPEQIEFYHGVAYRHLLVLRGCDYSGQICCKPPHCYLDSPISELLIQEVEQKGKSTAQFLNRMILDSMKILGGHPVNAERIKNGKNPANMIWPWGQGKRLDIKPLSEIHNVKGAVISAVDVVNGIGIYAGMDVVKVPGVTGFYDTNYEGKADYAVASLRDHDIVLVHVEAPDEASHIGDLQLKIKTIEDLDKRLIGRVLSKLQGNYSVAVLPDHPTSTALRMHLQQPVPFAIFTTLAGGRKNAMQFNESAIQKSSSKVVSGQDFMSLFLGR